MIELEDRGALRCLGDRLSVLARRHKVPGAQIALYHLGGTEAIEIGELRHRSGQRVTRNAAFPVGSISKTFTATLAMMLVADGEVEIDAPLGDHLSELDEACAELTLRQVLSHTAGLSSGPDSEDVSTATLSRYVRDNVGRHSLLLPPGVAFSYSNMGYVVAGLLIETITGMSWCQAMSSILLEPLGIEPAFVVGGEDLPVARPFASGHSVNTAAARTRPVHQSLAVAEAPAGALAVSAVDLVALGLMHVGDGVPGLLPPADAARMRAAVPAADPFGLADGWGLGLALFRGGGDEWVGHDGNADGTSCYLRVDPAAGWVVALTSNASTGLALWRDLLGELAGAGVPIEAAPGWAADAQPVVAPAGCAGTYANGSIEYLVLAKKGGLYLVVDDAAPTRLTCHQDLAFSLRDPGSGERVLGGRFLRDASTGRIDVVQLGGRLARRCKYTAKTGRREVPA